MANEIDVLLGRKQQALKVLSAALDERNRALGAWAYDRANAEKLAIYHRANLAFTQAGDALRAASNAVDAGRHALAISVMGP